MAGRFPRQWATAWLSRATGLIDLDLNARVPGEVRGVLGERLAHLVVAAGAVLLDPSETLLVAGDTVVQLGTMHAWHNRSDRPARMMFVNLTGQVTDRELMSGTVE